MKSFYLFIILIISPFLCMAQKLNVTDFKAAINDPAATQFAVKDGNGKNCALIIVNIAVDDAMFEGNIIKQERQKNGEYWVYITEGSMDLQINAKNYLSAQVDFENFEIVSVESGRTYRMVVERPNLANVPTGTMIIRSNLRDVDIYVDGQKLSSVAPFAYKGEEGQHSVVMKAPGYNDEHATINIRLNRKEEIRIDLKAAGSLSVEGVGYEMVRIEQGIFMMGSKEMTKYSTMNIEQPVHMVSLRSYMIGKTEVDQRLWQKVMGSNPSIHQGEDLPVENVTWYDCQEFINRLNQLTGKKYRLPTEAEWEMAATGGENDFGDRFGNEKKPDDVGHNGTSTVAVGAAQKPTPRGLMFMNGNVAEWCQDWFAMYTNESASNPTGPQKGYERVVRGGAFNESDWHLRNAHRGHLNPEKSSGTVGLRLAHDL